MFPHGREFLQTQGGNNKPVQPDNETTLAGLGSAAETTRDIHQFHPQHESRFASNIRRSSRSRFGRRRAGSTGTGHLVDLSSESKTVWRSVARPKAKKRLDLVRDDQLGRRGDQVRHPRGSIRMLWKVAWIPQTPRLDNCPWQTPLRLIEETQRLRFGTPRPLFVLVANKTIGSELDEHYFEFSMQPGLAVIWAGCVRLERQNSADHRADCARNMLRIPFRAIFRLAAKR